MTHRYHLFFGIALVLRVTFPSYAQTDEVIYHVVQRSFCDSNGDSHGDLNGLREKLDYLQALGVTSVLLLPLYHSEYYHNYFASDFETIDPEFGALDDYLALVRDLHARGMKLYMDMETQYITEDHLWYRDSYGNPASPYSGYLEYNGPGNTKPESIIFDLTELTGYDNTVRKVTTVNLLSRDVFTYNQHLFSYWTDPDGDGNFDDGVDGFRLDHMMNDLDWKGRFTDLFSRFWAPLIDSLKKVNPHLVFIAEQAQWESYGNEYIHNASVDKVFAFNLLHAINTQNKFQIEEIADTTFSRFDDHRDVIVMLENHDIDRYASAVDGDLGKLNTGAALNLLLGGTPSIYYGQEIGMQGTGGFGKFGNTDANDIPRREAFEWYRSVSGNGMALWYKDSGVWWEQTNLRDNDGISLEEQREDPVSLWNTYRSLIALRKSHPALINGKYRTLVCDNSSVVTFVRETQDEQVVVLINLSGSEQTVIMSNSGLRLTHTSPKFLYGIASVELQPYTVTVTLSGYEVVVLRF